jgi:hypothetical protein
MEKLPTNAEDIILSLGLENMMGYGSWPLPCPVDDEIAKLISIFIAATPLERKTVSEEVAKLELTFAFLAFSERMAILGIRENSESRLFEGLMAHVIEDFRYDDRENLLVISLLYHSAVKIGLNPVDLFQKAAAFARPEAANFILRFAQNPRSIHSMGYKEIMNPEGFSYKRTW